MIKMLQKTQQDYIKAKMHGDDKLRWCEVEGGHLLVRSGIMLVFIPKEHLHIKLDRVEEVTLLQDLFAEDESYQVAEYKGTTPEGLARYEAGELVVYADPKKLKIFTDVKGAQLKIQKWNTPIRAYTSSGEFMGCVMPCRGPKR